MYALGNIILFFFFLYISYLNFTVYFVYQFRIYCKIIGSHYEHLIQLIPYNSLVTSLFVIMKMFFVNTFQVKIFISSYD